MEHRKRSDEPFFGDGPIAQHHHNRNRNQNTLVNPSKPITKQMTDSTSSDSDDDETHYYVDPKVVLFCIELLSKYENQFSPNEYLMNQLAKKIKWSEYNLLVAADMFFGCLDKDAMLNAVVHHFKSKCKTAGYGDTLELCALKVLTYVLIIESQRINSSNLYNIICTFGIPLTIKFCKYILAQATFDTGLISALMTVYAPEFVEKELYPNFMFSAEVIRVVLQNCIPVTEVKVQPIKTTKVVPFNFQVRPKKESAYKKQSEELPNTSFKAKKVPKATYMTPDMRKAMQKERELKLRKSINQLSEDERKSVLGRISTNDYGEELIVDMSNEEYNFEKVEWEEEIISPQEYEEEELQNIQKSRKVSKHEGKGHRKSTLHKEDKRRSTKGTKKSIARKSKPNKNSFLDESPITQNIQNEEDDQKKEEQQNNFEETEINATNLFVEEGDAELSEEEMFNVEFDDEKAIKEGDVPMKKISETTEPKVEYGTLRRKLSFKEPTIHWKHTFTSVMRLQQIFRLRDEKERLQLEQLVSCAPLQEKFFPSEETQSKRERWEEIKLAIQKAKQKLILTKQENAKSVRQEREILRRQQLAYKQADLDRAKQMATHVMKSEVGSQNKSSVKAIEQKQKAAKEWKHNVRELLKKAKEKAKAEMTARDEKILKIKAREMISIKPIIIKNPFETRNNGIFDEMSEAESQLRLEVIRRQNEAQVGLLRDKIKHEKEEKAVKYKNALEEVEQRTACTYVIKRN